MDDIFKFNEHIKEKITPIMKNLGFKKTNLNFIRKNGRYLEKIVLQKSQNNLAWSEKTIFVNFYIYLQDEESYYLSYHRLYNKMKYAFFDNWSYFDENDLLKMITYLGKILENYTNTFFESMEKYLNSFPEITNEIKRSNNIERNCSEIFENIQNKIPEEEILRFDLEKERKLLPKIKICSYKDMIINQYHLNNFSATILNLGKELTGLKIIFFGDAIKNNNIIIEKIICSNYKKEDLFEVTEYKINEYDNEKYLVFSFDNLKMNPGYDEKKLSKLKKEDRFATFRAEKYHKFDEINFSFYYKINNPEGDFQLTFCPNENMEEGQNGVIIELRENEPTYDEIMKKYD